MSETAIPLIIRRMIGASCETLFDAFATAENLSRWFRPTTEIKVEVLEYSFQPNGVFRLRYHMPDGRRPVVGGGFDRIEKPVEISFSWVWEAPDPLEDVPMHVTFAFEPRGDRTEVIITHHGIPTDMACTIHADGWEGTLTILEAALEEGFSV